MSTRFATEKAVREFSTLPGCSQVVVSHGAYIFPLYRGQGHAYDEQKQSLKKMKELGYDYAICTVEAENIPQIKTLKKAKWYQLDAFISSRNGKKILVYCRGLKNQ